jgi:plastocyanin
MKTRTALLLTAAASIVAALGIVGPAAASRSATATKVTVTMYDFRFKLSKSSIPAGKVTFTVTNKGKSIHNFAIPKVKTSPFLAPGKSTTYTVTMKPGSYHYICTVPRHVELGMFGTLKVT